ncbi:hypothetical protein T5B8_07343 [Salinisphaera sp. T5B8]|uniref:MerC domain-containing protein n=1 Tax=unclassified Salinisphaera TaxID=2649847 RepID=UPI0033425503
MSRGSSSDFTGKFDKVAVILSGICLVHCLAFPLLIALFPVFGFSFVSHATFHQLILLVVVPTTTFALGMGYWRHRHIALPTLGLAGILLLVLAAFGAHALGAEIIERGVTVAGGLLLAAAHIQNYRLTRNSHDHRHERAPVSSV